MRQASCCLALGATLSLSLSLSLALALLAPARDASAAPPRAARPVAAERAANEQAVALYRQSTRAYDEGRFQDAVDLLQRAYALHEEPILLFNLARAYEGLGSAPPAIDAYTRYLARDPSSSDRRSIEQRIATLRKEVDERHALERQRDEERARVEQAQRAAETAARANADREDERRRRPSVLPWVVAGVGVAGIGAGIVLGVVSHGHYVDARDETYRTPAEADYSSAQSFATAANVAFVVGGVIAAAGLTWAVVDRLSKRAHVSAVGISSSGLSVHF